MKLLNNVQYNNRYLFLSGNVHRKVSYPDVKDFSIVSTIIFGPDSESSKSYDLQQPRAYFPNNSFNSPNFTFLNQPIPNMQGLKSVRNSSSVSTNFI